MKICSMKASHCKLNYFSAAAVSVTGICVLPLWLARGE